jgi:hypothetical protein
VRNFLRLYAAERLIAAGKYAQCPRKRHRNPQTMKLNHRATLSILALAVVSSVCSIGLAGLQLKPQRAAADVVVNTAIVAELNGVHDSLKDIPPSMRNGVLARHGVSSEQALDDSLEAQRSHLAPAEQARAQELQGSDKRSTLLLVLSLFNACATVLSAISLYEAYRAILGRAPLLADTQRQPV